MTAPTPEQEKAQRIAGAKAVFDAICETLKANGLTPEELNDALNDAAAAHYTPVPWSNQTPKVQDTVQADGGSGVVCYAYDAGLKDYVAVMVQANTDKAKLNGLVQIPGGFIDFSAQEDLLTAVRREVSEELRGPDGPLFPAPDEDRFVHLDHLLFYLRGRPRYVDGFAVELTQGELKACKDFIARLDNKEPGLRDAFLKATKNELYGMSIVPLRKIIFHPEILNHGDQISLFRKLDAHLKMEKGLNDLAAAAKSPKPR